MIFLPLRGSSHFLRTLQSTGAAGGACAQDPWINFRPPLTFDRQLSFPSLGSSLLLWQIGRVPPPEGGVWNQSPLPSLPLPGSARRSRAGLVDPLAGAPSLGPSYRHALHRSSGAPRPARTDKAVRGEVPRAAGGRGRAGTRGPGAGTSVCRVPGRSLGVRWPSGSRATRGAGRGRRPQVTPGGQGGARGTPRTKKQRGRSSAAVCEASHVWLPHARLCFLPLGRSGGLVPPSWARTRALSRCRLPGVDPSWIPCVLGAPEPGSDPHHAGGRPWPGGAVPQGSPCSP